MIQGYRDTGIQGYKDTGIQVYEDTGIQGYKDTGIQGYRDTGKQGYRDTRIQGNMIEVYKDKCMDTRFLQEYKDTQLPYLIPIPGFMDAIILFSLV